MEGAHTLESACLYQSPKGKEPTPRGRCSAMPHFRDTKCRGEGWLAGRADIGWSNSLGWYEGFRLLVAVDPTGVNTGFVLLRPPTSRLPRASSPCAIDRTLGCQEAWDRPSPRDSTWPRRALKAKKTIGAGCNAMECASSTRPSATA